MEFAGFEPANFFVFLPMKAAGTARLCARMFANVFLRVPGAAVSVDPTPPDGRTTRYGSRGHSRSPRHTTLPSKLRCRFDASRYKSNELSASNDIDASKRGEPLREGACGAVGKAGGAAVLAALGRRSRPRWDFPL